MESPLSEWSLSEPGELNVNNLLEAVAYFGDLPKRNLESYAAAANEGIPGAAFRTWTRGELLAFVIEQYPAWELDQD